MRFEVVSRKLVQFVAAVYEGGEEIPFRDRTG